MNLKIFETDSPSQSPSDSNYYSPTASLTPEPSKTPQETEMLSQTSEVIISSNDEIITNSTNNQTPINAPIINEPTISTYPYEKDSIKFDSDGYYNVDKYVPIRDDNSVSFVNSTQEKLLLQTNGDKEQNKELFVSPQVSNAVITIESPKDNDYGQSKFGVHANSNNPTINLPQTNVPLNLFNNQKSEKNIKKMWL